MIIRETPPNFTYGSRNIDLTCRFYITDRAKCKDGIKPASKFVRWGVKISLIGIICVANV